MRFSVLMTKSFEAAGVPINEVYGETYYENPDKTGPVWTFVEVFGDEFQVRPKQYIFALKLIKAAKDNIVAHNPM